MQLEMSNRPEYYQERVNDGWLEIEWDWMLFDDGTTNFLSKENKTWTINFQNE